MRAANQLGIVDQQTTGAARLSIEVDVLRYRQRGNQAELLEDHRHAQGLGAGRAVDCHCLTVNEDLATICGVDPRQDLHQRGLSRPISAHQGVYFAFSQRKVRFLENLIAIELLIDRPHFQHRVCFRHGSVSLIVPGGSRPGTT